MASNFAWGIDVGNRALKAIKLVREGDQLRVDDFDVIEHETVLSNAGDNREGLIQTALANFVQRHPFKGGQVAVGVSGQSSFARFIKLPPVEPKKIPEIVRFEAIQQIPFPLDDVEWSYQLFQAEDSPEVEVGIFAMRKELVNQHIKFYTDFDLNVQVVQMNPLAVYNAMYYDNRLSGTTMVIDLGAENTDLIICDNETIWLRSIPIGGNNFTDALVKAFKLNFAKAEDLKRNAATSKYARQIFQAMRPIFADLVAEIQRSVGFYASVHRDSRIKKILALGGTFKLPGLQKYLQQNLQLDVERLDTITAAPSSESKLAPTFNENILSTISAYGLAIQAMGQSKVTSSLLPAKIRREKQWKEKIPLFGAAAALFVAGLGVSVATWWLNDMGFKSNSAQAAHAEVTQVASQAKQRDADWAEIESSGAPARQKISNIEGLLDYRTLWPQLISDIQSTLPQVAKPPAAGAKVPRSERQVVWIDNMVSDYRADISKIIATPDSITSYAASATAASTYQGAPDLTMISPDSGAAVAAVAATQPRGFVITIHCTSPFLKGPTLVTSQMLPALKKIGPSITEPHKSFAIVNARLVSFVHIKEDQARMGTMKTDYDKLMAAQNSQNNLTLPSGGGSSPAYSPMSSLPRTGNPYMPRELAAAPGPAVPDENAPYLDRTTGESVLNDWEITLVALVQLDPPPPAPPAAAAPGAPQANAQ